VDFGSVLEFLATLETSDSRFYLIHHDAPVTMKGKKRGLAGDVAKQPRLV
jgi:hypothetical protein